jgi:hypothetical protein
VEAARGPYGLIAEFDTPDAILAAAKAVRAAGYKRFEAYTPFPVHGLADAVAPEDHRLKWLIFLGGAAGAAIGYGLQYWVSVIAYPHNVGGKPKHAWPAFFPVTFECMVLLASFAALLGMLGFNKLPRYHNPLFKHSTIHRVTDDRFFLSIEATDPKFDQHKTVDFLKSIGGAHVELVEE